MRGIMKKLIVIGTLVLLFFIVLIKSETIQTNTMTRMENGVEYTKTEQTINWDRFLNYIKNIPDEFLYYYRQYTNKK